MQALNAVNRSPACLLCRMYICYYDADSSEEKEGWGVLLEALNLE